MSKRAIIFHGTGGNPNVCWYGWLRDMLVSRGFEVEIPFYPTLNKESIETFLPTILKNHNFDENTVLVGHSGGAALLLGILEAIDVTVPQAILVAGYSTPPNDELEPVLQKEYDWTKIKSHVKDIVFINSTNDPYGCDDKQGRYMFDRIGGTLVVRNEGHFGSESQTFNSFALLNRLID